MDRKTNVRDIDGAKLGGVDAREWDGIKPGAKDSIPAIENPTEPFSGSVSTESLAGKCGGMNANK